MKKINFNSFIPFLILFAGLLILFIPIISDNSLMPGDLGDGRLINYLLEHGFQYLINNPNHSEFWTPPFFYPYKNTLCFSDVLLGGMIVYCPIRFFIKSPQTALQIWLFIVCILNYLSFFLLAKKIFKFNNLISSLGAFLFAFGLPRTVQIWHLQLFLQFYMIFAIYFFFKIKKENSKKQNHIYFFLTSLFYCLEFYTSFYLGYFMFLGCFTYLCVSFFIEKTRKLNIGFIKNFYKEIIIYCIISIVMLLPLITRYLSIEAQSEYRNDWLITFSSFISNESFLNKFIIDTFQIQQLTSETTIGLGIITSIFIIIGIFKTKYSKIILAFLSVILLIYSVESINYFFFNYFPAQKAIRSSGRCIFLLLPVLSICLCLFFKNIKKRSLLIIFMVLFFFEQIPAQIHYEWDKIEHKRRIEKYNFPKSCKIVFLAPETSNPFQYTMQNIDMMYYSSINNIKTVNGYSGYLPEFIEAVKEECTMTLSQQH